MKNLTPVDTFTDPVQCLEDGDGVVGGNSEVTAQALTNRTKNLDTRVSAIGARDAASGYVGLNADTHAAITATGGNATALTGVGNGTGAGLSGTGGATNAPGVTGAGTGTASGVTGQGGASSGAGVTGTGGATNGTGVVGQGAGTGNGVTGTGGSTGTGVQGIGNGATIVAASTALGGHFSCAGTGGSSTQDAIQSDQNIKMAGVNPNKDTAFRNRLTPLNLPKAWGNATSGGAGAPSFPDGFNVTSVTRVSDSQIHVTFAQAMADANYVVFFETPFGNLSYKTMVTGKTSSGFDIIWKNESTGSITDNSNGLIANFLVFGRQN